MTTRRQQVLLNSARWHKANDLAVPVDLEAALLAEGLSLESISNPDTKEDTDNG